MLWNCYDNGRILVFRNEVRVAEKCPSKKYIYIYLKGKLPPLQLLIMILHSKIFHICNFCKIYCDLFGDTWWCPVVPNWKGRNGDLQLFWGGSFIGFFSGLVTRVWTLGEFLPVQRKQMKFFGDKWWIEWCLFSCQLLGVNIRAGSMVQNHAMSSTCPFFVCYRHLLNFSRGSL